MSVHTYRYRLYPSDAQQALMLRFCGCARKVYNLCLDWWSAAYKQHKADGTDMGKMPDYSYYKALPEYAYLKQCDAVALQQARMHFQKAIDDFLKSKTGKRNGKRLGFPKHKKKGVSRDSYTTYNNGNNIHLTPDCKYITLPKIGRVRIVLHRPFCGKVKSVNVSRSRSGKWHVALTVECSGVDKPYINRSANAVNPKVVGLDMSMEHLVVSSEAADNAIPKRVRLYRKSERKLARLQRKVSRRGYTELETTHVTRKGNVVPDKAPGRNRRKAMLAYARYAEKVANRRREECIQRALYYVRRYDVVVIEDLDMQAMARSLNLGKSVNDIAFGEFRHWLEWEAAKYDCYVHYVDKWFASSKLCNECGYRYADLTLKEREWTCPSCGHKHDRDVNAAKNLRDEFLREYNTVGATGIYACGDGASTLRNICARALSAKQETNDAEVAVASSEAPDFSRG